MDRPTIYGFNTDVWRSFTPWQQDYVRHATTIEPDRLHFPPPDPAQWGHRPHYVTPAFSQYMPPQYSTRKVRRDTEHTAHLILSLATCGVWLPVWGVIVLVRKGMGRRTEVTRHG